MATSKTSHCVRTACTAFPKGTPQWATRGTNVSMSGCRTGFEIRSWYYILGGHESGCVKLLSSGDAANAAQQQLSGPSVWGMRVTQPALSRTGCPTAMWSALCTMPLIALSRSPMDGVCTRTKPPTAQTSHSTKNTDCNTQAQNDQPTKL